MLARIVCRRKMTCQSHSRNQPFLINHQSLERHSNILFMINLNLAATKINQLVGTIVYASPTVAYQNFKANVSEMGAYFILPKSSLMFIANIFR
jgi:hypothetical protein